MSSQIEMEELNVTYSKKAIRIAIAVSGVLSFYITALLASLINPNFEFAKFPQLLAAFFTVPPSYIVFPVLWVSIGVGAGFFLQKAWENRQRNDLLGRGFRHAKGDSTYGNAHFLRPYEYTDAAQIRKVEDCIGKILGQLTEDGEECLDFNPYEGRINSHMLAIGRSGGGKTFTFVLSFIFQAVKLRRSLIITDPKGDLFMQTSGYLRDNGYIVRTLNLKDLRKSDGWDMLADLEGPRLEENATIFAHTLAVNMSEDDKGSIYQQGSEALIKALILKVLLDPNNTKKDKTIRNMYSIVLQGSDFMDALFSDEQITEVELPAQRAYFAFKNTSPNLIGNIVTHVNVGLQLFQQDLVAQVFETPGIDMTLPGKRPCAYFCQFPDVHSTYSYLVALFFSMLFTYLSDYADLAEGPLTEDPSVSKKMGKLATPVDFLLDEFPSLGVLPDWDKKLAVMRSRRINIVMIIQDIPQLAMRYKESWKTIINNCGCILTLGINEPDDTAKWISNRCGTVTVEVNSSSEMDVAGSRHGELNKRVSVGLGKRSLLDPDEVCTLSRDGSIIIITDHNPIYVHKFPFTTIPDSVKLYDTLPRHILDLTDVEGRKILSAAEKAYLEQYWLTHEMHPKINEADMSKAMYLEQPAGPFQVAVDLIKEDFENLFGSSKKKKKEVKPKKDESYHFESVESKSFLKFYQQFVEHYGENAPEVSSSDIDITESTGEYVDHGSGMSGSFDNIVIDSASQSPDEFDMGAITEKARQSSEDYSYDIDQETLKAQALAEKAQKQREVERKQKEQEKQDKAVKKKRNHNRADFSFDNISVGDGSSGLPEAFKR